jgi:dienelactone hydrolase
MRTFLSPVWCIGICTLVSLMACSSDDSAPEAQFPATFSVIHFDSVTFATSSAFLQGGPKTAARITGELSLPASDEERLPAVILMHGSSGIGLSNRLWVDDLHNLGLATFLVDSLTDRGLAGVSVMDFLVRIVDAYQALAVLAQHPRIDASRIALMGWSQGGIVTLYAGIERFQHLYKSTEATFAAYVAFYPFCNFTLMQEDQRDGRPVRLLHGTADNRCAIGPCRELVARLRQLGQDITLQEFPDAHHSFDALSITEFTIARVPGRPVGATFADCFLVELPSGELVNQETGQEFTFGDPCVRFDGGNLGSLAARAEALKAVTTFFRDVFHL